MTVRTRLARFLRALALRLDPLPAMTQPCTRTGLGNELARINAGLPAIEYPSGVLTVDAPPSYDPATGLFRDGVANLDMAPRSKRTPFVRKLRTVAKPGKGG